MAGSKSEQKRAIQGNLQVCGDEKGGRHRTWLIVPSKIRPLEEDTNIRKHPVGELLR